MACVYWVVMSMAVVASGQTITTVAGTGKAGLGSVNTSGPSCALDQPFDVALDGGGNVYFSDTFNHRVLRMDSRTGMISLVAGTGKAGYSGDGGPAVAAELHEPYGLAVSRRGDVYVVDRLNRRVRRVSGMTRTITTIAGSGVGRYTGDGGPAVEAGLVEPSGVALAEGDRVLLIADVGDCRVRKVDLETGRISTLAGTGKRVHAGDGGLAVTASLAGPRAVEVGPGGTIYILEREGHRLRAIDPKTQIIRTVAGSPSKGYRGDGGAPLEAAFDGPKEMAIGADGSIFIVDTENQVIRAMDRRLRKIRMVVGSGRRGYGGDGGLSTQALLNRPHGVAVAPDGTLYVADTGNNRVRKVTPPPYAGH